MGILLPGPGSNGFGNDIPPEVAGVEARRLTQAIQEQREMIADITLLVVWFLSKQPEGQGVAVPIDELLALKGKVLRQRPADIPDTRQEPDPETGRSPSVRVVLLDYFDEQKVVAARRI